MFRSLCFSLASLTAATSVLAQPAPPVEGDKGDAKALLQSGLKLFAAKDYLGALSVFETAYARFPSGKILLNIGTTLRKLDRRAEAANAYQRYLDADDGDPAKRPEVSKVLAELDADLGILEITVTPADAELQVGVGRWTPAAQLAKVRVDAGDVVVRARKPGYVATEQSVSLGAGTRRSVALALAAEPEVTTSGGGTGVEGGVQATLEPEARSRLGAFGVAHIDPANQGMAVLVGLTADTVSRLQVQVAAVLGPSYGMYAGATFAFLDGRVRPIIAAGVPVFFSDGARLSLRAAAGVELALNRHFALIAELGVEYAVNPEPSITPTLFIPALGATARL
jgi:hypothetical protein